MRGLFAHKGDHETVAAALALPTPGNPDLSDTTGPLNLVTLERVGRYGVHDRGHLVLREAQGCRVTEKLRGFGDGMGGDPACSRVRHWLTWVNGAQSPLRAPADRLSLFQRAA